MVSVEGKAINTPKGKKVFSIVQDSVKFFLKKIYKGGFIGA